MKDDNELPQLYVDEYKAIQEHEEENSQNRRNQSFESLPSQQKEESKNQTCYREIAGESAIDSNANLISFEPSFSTNQNSIEVKDLLMPSATNTLAQKKPLKKPSLNVNKSIKKIKVPKQKNLTKRPKNALKKNKYNQRVDIKRNSLRKKYKEDKEMESNNKESNHNKSMASKNKDESKPFIKNSPKLEENSEQSNNLKRLKFSSTADKTFISKSMVNYQELFGSFESSQEIRLNLETSSSAINLTENLEFGDLGRPINSLSTSSGQILNISNGTVQNEEDNKYEFLLFDEQEHSLHALSVEQVSTLAISSLSQMKFCGHDENNK